MKETLRKSCIALPFVMLAALSGVNAAPYGPKGRPIEFTQPGGQKINLRVYGDEYYGRTETEDGYTVVYDAANRAYYYAKQAAKGENLKPSGVLAGRPAPEGLDKHIDCSADKVKEIAAANRARLAGKRDAQWVKKASAFSALRRAQAEGKDTSGLQAAANIAAAPVLGAKKGLTILVQFPNDPETAGNDSVNFPTSRAKMVNFCNQEGYADDGNTGSVRDYFYDQSGGKLTYTQSVTPIVTLNQPRDYYNFSDYPANNTYRDAGDSGNLLVADAIAILQGQGYDFSGLSTDTSNLILATNVIFAGQDSGVWAEGLWPHSWDLQNPVNVGSAATPAYVSSYQITNLATSSTRIGTFIHENGHLLMGYPDLYTYVAGTGEGVGLHCLMAAGNYCDDEKTPAPIDAYLKDVSGWANVNDLSAEDYAAHTLPSTGNITYRITNPSAATESFYIENRGNGDKWAKGVPDKGLLIWHIDETIADGNAYPFPHYGVSLEQADGRYDIENGNNLGDGGDAYDSSDPLFARNTTPNSRWWDNSNSSVRVKALSAAGSKMTVQFGNLPPNTIVVSAPNGGEILYRDSTSRIEWEANITGDVSILLYKGTSQVEVITAATENTGSFDWEVPKDIDPGTGYKIRIVSVTNPTPVFDESDGTFDISATSFPPNNVMPYGWHKADGAKTKWQVTNSRAFEGTHSLTSINPGDGQISGISYTSNFEAGLVSFYIRVSSEGGYDFGRFFIDGEAQLLPSAKSKRGISGLGSWIFASYSIPAGKHTFTWTYEKDDSMAGGRDAVWLDAVALPKTTQEILVRDENGVGLVSDKSLASFPKTVINKRSRPLTFTIRNRGKADLHGLSVSAKTGDAKSFAISQPVAKTLKPGQSTTFEVVFEPTSVGSKQTELRIASNDTDENPFIIHAIGNSKGVPEIVVSQPADSKLKDGKSTVNFGYSKVGQEGSTKVFTVKNIGTADLTGLKVKKSGPAKSEFDVSDFGARTLAPGESATFKITFTPAARDKREAELHIVNDYKSEQTFDVNLVGNGVPKNVSKSDLIASTSGGLLDAVFGAPSPSAADQPVIGSLTIGGSSYKTLTFTKPSVPDGVKRTVEVSSNLVDWFSGAKHTSIVADTATYQTVRDNTAAAPGVKRHIRLKTTNP